jgi:hypothetical protein
MMERFARITREIAQAVLRLRPKHARYRPEHHYMRGSGPKSMRPGTAGKERDPKAT